MWRAIGIIWGLELEECVCVSEEPMEWFTVMIGIEVKNKSSVAIHPLRELYVNITVHADRNPTTVLEQSFMLYIDRMGRPLKIWRKNWVIEKSV